MLPRSVLILSAVLSACTGATAHLVCNQYSTRFRKPLEGICVCNTTHCDSVSNEYLDLQPHQVGVYTTSKAGDRLTFSTLVQNDSTQPADLIIDIDTEYQSILGFGGTFTDAAATNLYRLAPSLQQTLLDSYYTSQGIEYSLGRVPIGSTDFSETIYSYNPVVDDLEMKHFSIDVDRHSRKLELIKRAQKTANYQFDLFASSWAPPIWMTIQNRTENCHIKENPGRTYWKALALYYARFFEEYNAENITFWAMSAQNEPGRPIIQPNQWQSLRLTPEEEREFIKRELGPLMRQRFPDLKIIAHDDQKPNLMERMVPLLSDPEARQYVHGVGVHWYENIDFLLFNTGGYYDRLTEFHQHYPDIFILATEACEGFLPKWLGTGAGVHLHDTERLWTRGENYARDIINDLANFASGWMDWNIALDSTGGPNWPGNWVDSPIIVDEQSGHEFYKQPMYYVMGHFSKFVPAGSKRVELQTTEWSKTKWNQLDRVAFVTPDQRVVLIMLNRKDTPTTVTLQVTTANAPPREVTVTLGVRTLKTIVFPAKEA